MSAYNRERNRQLREGTWRGRDGRLKSTKTPPRDKSKCVNGHRYTEENTAFEKKPTGLVVRRCKTCMRKTQQRARERNLERRRARERERWRNGDRKRGPLAPGDPRHGTINGYNSYECRCQACKDAIVDYHRERKRKRRLEANTEAAARAAGIETPRKKGPKRVNQVRSVQRHEDWMDVGLPSAEDQYLQEVDRIRTEYVEDLIHVVEWQRKAKALGRDPRHYVAERMGVSIERVLKMEQDVDAFRRGIATSREDVSPFGEAVPRHLTLVQRQTHAVA
jgi:hypothetical protein